MSSPDSLGPDALRRCVLDHRISHALQASRWRDETRREQGANVTCTAGQQVARRDAEGAHRRAVSDSVPLTSFSSTARAVLMQKSDVQPSTMMRRAISSMERANTFGARVVMSSSCVDSLRTTCGARHVGTDTPSDVKVQEVRGQGTEEINDMRTIYARARAHTYARANAHMLSRKHSPGR